MRQELFLGEEKKKVALSEGVFLFVYVINLNRIGQFGLKRKTGSVLRRIALWDFFGPLFFFWGGGGGAGRLTTGLTTFFQVCSIFLVPPKTCFKKVRINLLPICQKVLGPWKSGYGTIKLPTSFRAVGELCNSYFRTVCVVKMGPFNSPLV